LIYNVRKSDHLEYFKEDSNICLRKMKRKFTVSTLKKGSGSRSKNNNFVSGSKEPKRQEPGKMVLISQVREALVELRKGKCG